MHTTWRVVWLTRCTVQPPWQLSLHFLASSPLLMPTFGHHFATYITAALCLMRVPIAMGLERNLRRAKSKILAQNKLKSSKRVDKISKWVFLRGWHDHRAWTNDQYDWWPCSVHRLDAFLIFGTNLLDPERCINILNEIFMVTKKKHCLTDICQINDDYHNSAQF